jgi:glycosyltransferase involved in cell wall biosynthesis
MRWQRGFYASNTFHYRHVVGGMQRVVDEVTLAARFEVSPETVRRLRRWPLSAGPASLLNRRAVQRMDGVRYVGLGPGQFLPPLMGRIDALNTLPNVRRTHVWEARAVAGHAARIDADVFWFMEGLGHRALGQRSFDFSVCERRALHHAVLETDPGIVGDFPFSRRPDPIGDLLQFEYDNASVICVYSRVARDSFLERGFQPDRVLIVPLGVSSPVVDDLAESRDPNLVSFVGRCDAFKGIDVAVAAVAQLGSQYRLEVAGPASERVQRWLSTHPRVNYRGILAHQELVSLYRRSGVLVSPSIESFGYAAFEGAAHGAHLVCSTRTGASEFLPDGSHLVVPGRDPEQWAEAIRAASHSRPNVAQIRTAVQALSWANSANAVEKLLTEAGAR